MTKREQGRRTGARITDTFIDEVTKPGGRLDFEPLLAVEPASPASELKARLMDSVRSTHRFDDLELLVAELADVPPRDAAALLLAVDTDDVWDRGAALGVDVFHFTGGPKVRDAITGFIRMSPGGTFPEHEHVGDEAVLVMTGTIADSGGTLYQPGDVARMSAGSRHSFRAVGQTRLLLMTVVQRGVIIDGQRIPPGDPRA